MTTKTRHIIAGSGLMAIAYFISRFLGLIREMVIAYKFGAGEITDIYNASFLIPDMLNYMLAAGAFSVVLIPMLSKYVDEGPPARINERGQEIFAAIFTPVSIIIILLTILCLFLTPWFLAVFYPDFLANPAKFTQLVTLTRIILPAQVFFIVGGLINATLRARGDFRANAWQPCIYNVGIILGGLALGTMIGIKGLSIGVLLGAATGPLLLSIILAKKTIRYTFSLDFKSRDLKEYIKLTLPLMVGVSLLTVDQLFHRFFGARQGVLEGTITCLNYGRTVMLVPIALVGQAVGQVSLTFLSQLFQQGKSREFTQTLNQTMRGVIYLSFILAGAIFLLAHPLITLLFHRGAFTAINSLYTAHLLRLMIFAVPAFAALQILMNGYYARKNTLRPMIISTLCTVASFFLYFVLQEKAGGPGIALATLLGFWVLFLVTLYDYYRKYGTGESFDLRAFVATTLKAPIATFAGIGITWFIFQYSGLLTLNPGKKLDAALILAIMGCVYGGIVFGVSLLLGGEEAETLKKLIRKIKKIILKRG